MRRVGFVVMAALLAVGALLGGCSDDDGDETDAGSNGEQSASEAGDGAPDTVLVTIDDGPDAGEHEASGGVGCVAGLADGDAFGVQFFDRDTDEGLSRVEVLVRDGPAAAEGDDDFTAAITIGDIDAGTAYEVQPGTATVDVDADEPVLVVEGATDDGTDLTIVVRCGRVRRT